MYAEPVVRQTVPVVQAMTPATPAYAHGKLGSGFGDTSTRAPSARAEALQAQLLHKLAALSGRSADRPRKTESRFWVEGHEALLPRRLLHDRVLEPVDKIVWAELQSCIDESCWSAFPSHALLARMANVSSEATVARALVILRATRWLTFFGRHEDFAGRDLGKVFVLTSEPLTPEEASYLDPSYGAFVQHAMAHSHARVRLIAARAIGEIAKRTHGHQNLRAPTSGRGSGSASEGAPQNSRPRKSQISKVSAPQYLRLVRSRDSVAEHAPIGEILARSGIRDVESLVSRTEPVLLATENFEPQKLGDILRARGGCCSSKDLTTTTTVVDASNFEPRHHSALLARQPGESDLALSDCRWPEWLSGAARSLASAELGRVPEPLRQTLLDQLDRRRQEGFVDGLDPLRHPIRYLRTLCGLAIAGRIKPTERTPATPAAEQPIQPVHVEALRQQLVTAVYDHRHWRRLIDTDVSPAHRTQWQAFADQSLATIARCQAALKAAERCESSDGSQGVQS